MTPLALRVRALLRAYGPATARDLAIVTGRTDRRIRQVLPGVALVVRPLALHRYGATPTLWGVR